MTETKQVGRAGKYDEIAERLCKDLKAGAIVLIVVDGRHGHGMAVSVNGQSDHRMLAFGDGLAELLHASARQLETGAVAGPAGARFTSGLKEPS